MNDTDTSYDEVPYISRAFPQTHPDRLATIGFLFGIEPASTDHCRVLEIGCASGENLLPMACRSPESTFVGIDLSAVQIRSALSAAESVGARNVQFLHADICDLPPTIGRFDYIIAHGVYSWISDSAQEALLHACHKHLLPQGICYVSYNTFPGWHMRGMIRDMMTYRVKNISTPTERICRARELLHFLAGSVATENNAYGILLNNELRLLSGHSDTYLFHEHLEEHNSPLYFHQFVDRAESVGLQYLGEADFSTMFVDQLPASISATLREVATTLVEAEQYMDFVRNRTFRQTLLCHKSVVLDRSLSPTKVLSLWIGSPTRPEAASYDITNDDELSFRNGASIATSSDRLTKAALLCLGESWPRRHPCLELIALAKRKLAVAGAGHVSATVHEVETLARALLGCYANGHVELSVRHTTCTSHVSEQPIASHSARVQARFGPFVTNEFHTTVELQDYERRLLQELDGSHTIDSLANHIYGLVQSGTLHLRSPRDGDVDAEEVERLVRRAAMATLQQFAHLGLLVG